MGGGDSRKKEKPLCNFGTPEMTHSFSSSFIRSKAEGNFFKGV